MRCPVCGGHSTKVLDSRDTAESTQVRRRRCCVSCGHRFTTRERIEEQLISVLKKDGQREPLDRAKIRRGLELACRKRPIRSEQIDAVVTKIEHWASTRGDREVRSSEIGDRIAHHLHEIDDVAYVRFVSVYRSFDTVEEFEDLLHEMEKAERVDPEGQRTLFEPVRRPVPAADGSGEE